MSRTRNTAAPKGRGDRGFLINLIERPIQFFTLAILVVEALLAGLAALTDGTIRIVLISGMLVLLFLLVAIVAIFAFVRPEALAGKRPRTRQPQISTGLLQLLHSIRNDGPVEPRRLSGALFDFYEVRESRQGLDPALEGWSDIGWQKAAVYGCLHLINSGYLKIQDSKVAITPAGIRILKTYLSTGVSFPNLPEDDSTLLVNQSDQAGK